jgi:uncharacterized protein (TIGR00251 family)
MDEKSYYRWQGDNLLLELYIRPRASKDAIVGQHGDRLKITITAPPVEDKANKHLIKFLAKYFGVPQNQVKIVKGETSKNKSILVFAPKNRLLEFKP